SRSRGSSRRTAATPVVVEPPTGTSATLRVTLGWPGATILRRPPPHGRDRTSPRVLRSETTASSRKRRERPDGDAYDCGTPEPIGRVPRAGGARPDETTSRPGRRTPRAAPVRNFRHLDRADPSCLWQDYTRV